MSTGIFLSSALGLLSPAVRAEDPPESVESVRGSGGVPIQSAELLTTAHTLERGQVTLHPIFWSEVGVGRNIDIQFPTLGILDGPSLGVEYMALDTESLVLSVEPFFRSRSVDQEEIWGWSLQAVSSGATVRATVPHGSSRLNLATAAVYDGYIERLAVPLEAEFDLVISDRTVLQIGMGTDLANDLRGAGNLAWMVHWNHGWGRYRLSLGATVTHGQASGVWDRSVHLDSDPSEGHGLQPHLAMWWLLDGNSARSDSRMQRPTGWHQDSSTGTRDASQGALSLRQPRISYGLSWGLGVRYLSLVEVPDGVAPRLDLGVLEVRRSLHSSYRYGPEPARIDLQVDLAHAYWSTQATRWPRLPVLVYSTWLRPSRKAHSMVLSSGVYSELGVDRFVRDEVLVRRPAAAVGAAGRIGREKHRRRSQSGVYLRGVAGVNLGTDPDHAHVTRYLRLGVELSWLWGLQDSAGVRP